MESKPHRTNSDFQLRHFMAGSCHTPDGAWALLYGQKISVEDSIAVAESQRLRREAKIDAAQAVIDDAESPPWVKKQASAEIIEVQATEQTWRLNLEAARQELATIMKIMDELEPQRKYKHLPVLEANEAMQRDEWLGELNRRAENFLITQGTIPPEHLEVMRKHPDFVAVILPHIRSATALLDKTKDRLTLLEANNGVIDG